MLLSVHIRDGVLSLTWSTRFRILQGKKGKKSVFVVILKLHCVSCLVSQLMVPKPLECNSDTSQIDDHVVLSFILESALICAPLIELA